MCIDNSLENWRYGAPLAHTGTEPRIQSTSFKISRRMLDTETFSEMHEWLSSLDLSRWSWYHVTNGNVNKHDLVVVINDRDDAAIFRLKFNI